MAVNSKKFYHQMEIDLFQQNSFNIDIIIYSVILILESIKGKNATFCKL